MPAKNITETIKAFVGSFCHVHISENDRGTPGTGHVHWDETFRALREVKYDGWLVIEAFGRALPALAAATRVWRDLFPNAEEVYTQMVAPERSLPGTADGWRIIESLRSDGVTIPVIVVSARGSEQDKVHALGLGSDDYLAKPFGMGELVARVQAAVRRAGTVTQPSNRGKIEVPGLVIDYLGVYVLH